MEDSLSGHVYLSGISIDSDGGYYGNDTDIYGCRDIYAHQFITEDSEGQHRGKTIEILGLKFVGGLLVDD